MDSWITSFKAALKTAHKLHVKTGIQHYGCMPKLFLTPYAGTQLIAACHSEELPVRALSRVLPSSNCTRCTVCRTCVQPGERTIRTARLYILAPMRDDEAPVVLSEVALPPSYACICGGRVYAVLPRLSRAQQPASTRAPIVHLCMVVTLTSGSMLTLASDACDMRRQLDGNSTATVGDAVLRGHQLDDVMRSTTSAAYECIVSMRMGVAPDVDLLAGGFDTASPCPDISTHAHSGVKRAAVTVVEADTELVRVQSRKKARDAGLQLIEFAAAAAASSISADASPSLPISSAVTVETGVEEVVMYGSTMETGAPSARRRSRASKQGQPTLAAASAFTPAYSTSLLSPVWTQPPRAILLGDVDGDDDEEASAPDVLLLLRDNHHREVNVASDALSTDEVSREHASGVACLLARRDASMCSTMEKLLAVTSLESSQVAVEEPLTQMLEKGDENACHIAPMRPATPITETMISSIWERTVSVGGHVGRQ